MKPTPCVIRSFVWGHDRTILRLLREHGSWMTDQELHQAAHGTEGHSATYVVLHRLEDRGLVEARLENDSEFRPRHPDQMRRSLYRITKLGLAQLE